MYFKYKSTHYPLLTWQTLNSFVYISYPAESILPYFPVLKPGLQLDFVSVMCAEQKLINVV
jgi:hypothetical protein